MRGSSLAQRTTPVWRFVALVLPLLLLFTLRFASLTQTLAQDNAHVQLLHLATAPNIVADGRYATVEPLLRATGSWRNHGTLLTAAGFPDQARASYQQALAAAPADLLASYFLGMNHLNAGEETAAIGDWQAVNAEEIVTALSRFVEEAIDRDDAGEAERWADYLIRVAPGSFTAQYWAGRGYREAELYAKAAAAFDRAEQIGTDDTDVLVTSLRHQGDMHLALAQWPEAIDAFQRAFALDPHDVRIQTNLGWALVRAGRYDEAEEQLLAVVAADPAYGTSYRRLAFLYQEQGDVAAAVTWYTRAYKVEPDSSAPLRQAGILLFRQENDFEQARDYFQRATAVEPDDSTNWQWLGRTYGRLARWSEMEAAYETAVAAARSEAAQVDLLTEWATTLTEQDQHERALAVWQQILEIRPGNDQAQEMIEAIEAGDGN